VKYAVVTFGCRVNQADSLGVEAALSAAGATAVSSDQADVVLVNTCSVTASADQGARQTIRRIHRENPGARIVVTGCFASRAADDVAALPGVTAIVPNAAKATLAGTLLPLLDLPPVDGPCGRLPGPGLMGRTAWTLRAASFRRPAVRAEAAPSTTCWPSCAGCSRPATRKWR
jgi:Uncharacterized protein family UPF0004